MAKEQRELYRTIIYTVPGSGLNKMGFDSPMRFVFGSYSEMLSNVQFREGEFSQDYTDGEKGSKKIICPVYLIRADVGTGEHHGTINGVIRPTIDDFVGDIVKGLPPQFHFVFEGVGLKAGKSFDYSDDGLIVVLSDWSPESYSRLRQQDSGFLPPGFEAQIAIDGSHTGYFQRS